MGYYYKHGSYPDTTSGACPLCGCNHTLWKTEPLPSALPPVGWTCPVCGCGVAPWVTVCPCRDSSRKV